MTISHGVTQQEFDTFTLSHPRIEIIEVIGNDTISNLQSLTKLNNLYGLTIMDTVTDLATVKTLKNLKYLSLPLILLEDSIKKAELQRELPDTRIVANEGFCMGSGWLLLLFPIVLILRFFAVRKKQANREMLKS
jgi:hypothetical protein